MTSSLRLEAVNSDNVGAACRLRVQPDQEHLVDPVAWSLADAYVNPATTWPRLIFDADELVGFVMGEFDPRSPVDEFRCRIWRLNIAAGKQGRGYGRFAVEAVIQEARRRGQRRLTVLWVPGENSPEQFYLRLGFRATGRRNRGRVVGELLLPEN
ncbi:MULTISPECIES: N-acetyltransferase [Streptacidiphilus]|uniref:GNAT family N-acetyltransferase n=1 Tax=Streptacidiphilus cavernicola TaxID=3342716 RepID=A0ABV6UE73_9ACTN|nr:GNAT family N-acetyltransferase [Streptacidiphilus jeojiense]